MEAHTSLLGGKQATTPAAGSSSPWKAAFQPSGLQVVYLSMTQRAGEGPRVQHCIFFMA